jgi:K+ transporter
LKNEISKVKDLVLYLQNKSLEVNEKLVHILFNSISEEEIVEEETVVKAEDPVVEGEKEAVVEEVVEPVVEEVKEFVEKNE